MTGLTFLLSTAAALLQGTAPLAASQPDTSGAQSPPAQTQAETPVESAVDAFDADAQDVPQRMERESQRPREVELARIDTYFSGLDTLRAGFEQVGADGAVATGTLSLDRPGRVRFEYEAPTPILLVADGQTVAIADFDLETVDRLPIAQTPLKWLLEPDLDPASSSAVDEVSRFDGALYLSLVDPDNEIDGRVTLVFEDSDPEGPAEDMRLAGWIAVDAMGGFTEVRLTGNERGVSFNPRLFVLDDDLFERSRRTRR